MTAADQLDTAVARPDAEGSKPFADKIAPDDVCTSKSSCQTHLHRRSSFQKIMHICNQSYSAFPHVLIRLQDVHTTITIDLKNLVLLLRSVFLNIAVTLAIFTLFSQFVLFFLVGFYHTKRGPVFLILCVLVLGLFAFRCFSSVNVVKRVHRSMSCRRKSD